MVDKVDFVNLTRKPEFKLKVILRSQNTKKHFFLGVLDAKRPSFNIVSLGQLLGYCILHFLFVGIQELLWLGVLFLLDFLEKFWKHARNFWGICSKLVKNGLGID